MTTMTTLSVTLSLIGFYMLYSGSKRAKLVLQYDFQKWLTENPKIGKFAGLFLLFISLISSVLSLGIASGIFSFIVILMTIASLVVLTSPLRFFNLFALILIAIVCFGAEFLFF